MGIGRYLTLMALAAALLAGLASAQAPRSSVVPAETLEPFVFSPQWTAQAQFAGYYVASRMGFYEEEGLDVEIVHPYTSQSARDRFRQGQSDAATLTLAEAMEVVDAGIPVVNILQTSMNSAMLIVSRYGEDPQDLKHPKVIMWRGGFSQVALCMAAREHLDYQWVEAASVPNLFVSGAVDATLAMSYNEYYQLLQTGLLTPGKGIYRFSEHGYNIQEDGVYMTAEAYRNDRDKAERFARASRRGWEWAAEHPEEALDIVMDYVRELRIPTNRVLQKLMLDEILRLQLDPDSGEREFRLRPDMVRQASGLLSENGIISREIDYKELVP